MSSKRIIFITGTDTGVGKTLFTALMLHHLRKSGQRALAVKPFCSGSLDDVRILQALQPDELSNAEMNPFYFKEPVAPLVAARKNGREIKLNDVVRAINRVQKQCSQLLVEGSGGLLVPLGKKYAVADLIARLNCRVIIIARNRLGTINHTLLTINVLRSLGIAPGNIGVVLMEARRSDISSATNEQILSELLNPITIFRIPFLGPDARSIKAIKNASPRVEQTLTSLLEGIGSSAF